MIKVLNFFLIYPKQNEYSNNRQIVFTQMKYSKQRSWQEKKGL